MITGPIVSRRRRGPLPGHWNPHRSGTKRELIMPNPHLKGWIAATVPKAGSRAEENEDAPAGDAKRVRFALADGATEGWQSGGWARHLVKAYVERPPGPADFDQWLAIVRQK